MGIQTNGLVLFSSCNCPKPLNSHVLLPDRDLKLGGILLRHSTCSWVVRPHVWNLHIQSILEEYEVAKNSHVSGDLAGLFG